MAPHSLLGRMEHLAVIVMVSLTLLAGLSECDPQQFMRRQDTNMSQTEKSRQRGGQQEPREGKQEPLLDPLDSPLTSPSNLLQAYFLCSFLNHFQLIARSFHRAVFWILLSYLGTILPSEMNKRGLNENWWNDQNWTQLSNLWWIPNSVSIGFGPAWKWAHQDDSNDTPQSICECQVDFPVN